MCDGDELARLESRMDGLERAMDSLGRPFGACPS